MRTVSMLIDEKLRSLMEQLHDNCIVSIMITHSPCVNCVLIKRYYLHKHIASSISKHFRNRTVCDTLLRKINQLGAIAAANYEMGR